MSNFLIGLSDVQRFGQNYVINGNFDFWQRGTSLGAAASIRYLADRFLSAGSGTTAALSRQAFAIGQTEVPNNPKYFHRAVIASSAGVGNLSNLQHRLEDVTKLAGKTVTLSFWAKADSPKQASTEFTQVFGTGGSPSTAVNAIGVQKFNLTSSWKKFTRTVTLPSVAGKTLGTNNDDFLQLTIFFDAGSNFNSRTDSLGHQSGTFDIAQVKLEEGSVATPFVLAGGTIQGELAACQRYYEKSYNINVAPASVTNTGAFALTGVGVGNRPFVTTSFKQTKRASLVAVTFYNPRTGLTTNPIWDTNTASTDYSVVTQVPSETGFYFAPGGTLPASASAVVHWTADAEL